MPNVTLFSSSRGRSSAAQSHGGLLEQVVLSQGFGSAQNGLHSSVLYERAETALDMRQGSPRIPSNQEETSKDGQTMCYHKNNQTVDISGSC